MAAVGGVSFDVELAEFIIEPGSRTIWLVEIEQDAIVICRSSAQCPPNPKSSVGPRAVTIR
jgi:hypothetical protein